MPTTARYSGRVTPGVLSLTLLALTLVALGLSPLHAQQGRPGPPPQVPIFRSGVGAVLVDFKAMDRQGRFVSDLTAADVKVFEDGVEQQVSTFSLVNVPTGVAPAAPPRPGWPEPDTATNTDADGRLYLIALDDVHVNPQRSDTVQQLAREFTNSQPRLLASVDKFVAGFGAFSTGDATSNREAARNTFHYLESLATWLGALEGRRKTIVFISEGFTGEFPAGMIERGGAAARARAVFGPRRRHRQTGRCRGQRALRSRGPGPAQGRRGDERRRALVATDVLGIDRRACV